MYHANFMDENDSCSDSLPTGLCLKSLWVTGGTIMHSSSDAPTERPIVVAGIPQMDVASAESSPDQKCLLLLPLTARCCVLKGQAADLTDDLGL